MFAHPLIRAYQYTTYNSMPCPAPRTPADAMPSPIRYTPNSPRRRACSGTKTFENSLTNLCPCLLLSVANHYD